MIENLTVISRCILFTYKTNSEQEKQLFNLSNICKCAKLGLFYVYINLFFHVLNNGIFYISLCDLKKNIFYWRMDNCKLNYIHTPFV